MGRIEPGFEDRGYQRSGKGRKNKFVRGMFTTVETNQPKARLTFVLSSFLLLTFYSKINSYFLPRV